MTTAKMEIQVMMHAVYINVLITVIKITRANHMTFNQSD